MLCEILRSHGGQGGRPVLLGCDAVRTYRKTPTCRLTLLKMEAVRPSETLVFDCESIRRHSPEEQGRHLDRCGNTVSVSCVTTQEPENYCQVPTSWQGDDDGVFPRLLLTKRCSLLRHFVRRG
jgi:hypothetical protein